MGLLHCCGALRRSVSYGLEPQDGYLLAELDVVDECPVCGHFIVQITRIDYEHRVSIVRKSNRHARKLFDRVETSILFKKERCATANAPRGNSYLYYNEYGVKKRCYSNLSTLKMGLKNPDEGLFFTNPLLISGFKKAGA